MLRYLLMAVEDSLSLNKIHMKQFHKALNYNILIIKIDVTTHLFE
mgnify:CR=1 FL=1